MDLLNKIGGNRSVKGELLDEDNVELSLCLSSNGRFGVDRRLPVADCNNNRLVRCSSIADLSSESVDPTSLALNPLMRTCSLPVETEAEWKKRKELQTLRRSEAKRKRVEKIKSGRVVVVKGMLPEESCEVKRRSPSLLPPLPRPVMAPAQVAVGSPASGGSSGVSDLECQPSAGTNKETELKSTATQQPDLHQMSSSTPYRSNSIPSHTTPSQTFNRNLARDEALKTMFADMPCVTTKGDGVNGKKIEGFLYRYRKGEEVRIVCVCHGNFLTPAEFVKHGGGGDVEHPLRHIVVLPPTL